jgi:enolase-phosphatase E1
MAITHLLLDIEGTTCPVSFVAEVLFPYARAAIGPYCEAHGNDPEVKALLEDVDQAWQQATTTELVALRQEHRSGEQGVTLTPYLHWLIDHDVKLTALKDLQGRIWAAGYASGDLIAPLYADVPAALKRWQQQGFSLAVYSSGSVPAQKLLYGHSQVGDLTGLFSHWFDTRTGLKQAPESYTTIAERMEVAASSVLFISDALRELEAASSAGMNVLFSDRDGNPERDSGRFEKIGDYSKLTPDHGHQRP